MNFITLIGTAFSLAMDAFAVSVASGIALKEVTLRHTFRLSWHFGFFQAFMPFIGWSCCLTVREYVEQYDHWVAFGLLVFVGGNMIRGAFQHQGKKIKNDPTKGKTLVILSIATSIDALAIGLSLSMLKVSILLPVIVIGVIAAVFTAVGIQLGKKVGKLSYMSSYAEILGGIVLFGIGLNILRGHGVLDHII